MTSLSIRDLAVGDEARVVGYAADSAYARRLAELGLIPGTIFTIVRFAPLGDPVAIRFRGYSLVLRPAEASELEVERL